VANTWNLFTNFRIYAQVDARGGHIQFMDALGAKHTSFSNTYCTNVQDDPICMGQKAINRAPLGFHEGGFARLRELSFAYTLPSGFAERMGLSRASIQWGWSNVALLWFPGKWAGDILGAKDPQRIADPEMNAPSEGFGGEVVTGLPPLSHSSVTVRVAF
jgi:hypothetical protein